MPTWRIEVVGQGQFPATESHTLLSSAEAAGRALPHGCRTGACLNCAARLVDGRISMPPGTALTEAHLADHIILPCVAVPRSDCEIEVGQLLGVLAVAPWTD